MLSNIMVKTWKIMFPQPSHPRKTRADIRRAYRQKSSWKPSVAKMERWNHHDQGKARPFEIRL